jgi:hypothetical protein
VPADPTGSQVAIIKWDPNKGSSSRDSQSEWFAIMVASRPGEILSSRRCHVASDNAKN